MTELPSYLLDDPKPVAAPKPRGWFRRNLWGLLTIVPVTAAMLVVALDKGNAYERYWKFQPRVPVVAAGGWANYMDARVQLVEAVPANDVRDYGGKVFAPPPGTQVWRVVLKFDVPDQKTVQGCEVWLEDDQGRIYGSRAAELRNAKVPVAGCTAEDELLSLYQGLIFFILPSDARPVAVRITLGTSLPRYARLNIKI